MRRKIICLALAACFACGTLGGCNVDTEISQADYDQVVYERDELQKELEAMTEKYNDLATQINESNNSSSSVSEVPATSAESPISSSPSTPSTQVLLEYDGIKITFTGMGSDYLGPKIKLRIENDSDQPITVQQRDMSINGAMIDGILSEDVRPGKISNTDISILSPYLEENDITTITDIELSFHIFHSDTWDTILDSDTVTIQI